MIALRRLLPKVLQTISKTTTVVTTATMSSTSGCSRQLDASVLPQLDALLTPDVRRLCKMFLEREYEIRVVGGGVRDMFMDQPPKDIDLSTTATPEQMVELFTENEVRYIETGLQHGTLTAHINDGDYEITTLRIDTETDGRKAVVTYTTDWFVDAQRRDFTVNAMSVDVDGVLFDYFNGEKDLLDRKIRFVGQDDHRIKEDYLRILRYFRFFGKIGASVESHQEETLATIKQLSSGLQQIAVERVWVEVKKILVGHNASHLLRLMYSLDVAANINLPECTEKHLADFEQVWNYTRGRNPEPVTLLCTLIDTPNAARELSTKWKLSNFERDLSVFITTHRHKAPACGTTPLKPYQDLIVGLSNVTSLELVRGKVIELLQYEGKLEEADEIRGWDVPVFPVTGLDLKRHGLKTGPPFGKTLNKLKEMWMDSYYQLSKESLLAEVDSLYAMFAACGNKNK